MGYLDTFYKRLDESYWMNPQFKIEFFLTRNGRAASIQRIPRLLSGEAPLYKNSVRKNLFLSACHSLDEIISLHEIDQKVPFGGLIGYGDSHLDKIFRFFKVFGQHEILHDVAGAIICTTAKDKDTVN